MEKNQNEDSKPGGTGGVFNSFWIYGIILAVLLVVHFATNGQVQKVRLSTREFFDLVVKQEVARVQVQEDSKKAFVYIKEEYLSDAKHKKVAGNGSGEGRYHYLVETGPIDQFQDELKKKQESAGIEVPLMADFVSPGIWPVIMTWLIPIGLILLVWLIIMRRMAGGPGGPGSQIFNIGKSKATLFDQGTKVDVTFADVAGLNEAKEEVMEVVDFLKNPKKYTSLGGKIPKGVLLVGAPGTGKTLLAKAVAGEAGVPFFSISGSDFVEMFVGVGASRVRDLFRQAREKAPCIVFIDEIDAIGRARGRSNIQGGNDERENTLNQLLVEMDGFPTDKGVILMAATNRPDILDQALMRPGRFDRQVVVPLPDIRGREQILKVHMRKVPIAPDVDPQVLARGTPGFAGADLANLVNEAALFAARGNKRLVDMDDFERAKDKIMMGAERRSVVMPEEERRNTAYHESGHAVVARLLDKTDPVHKVTIIPRGRALGVTMQLPTEDRYSQDRERLLQTITVLFGGRIAEEIFMKQMTTGASNDFARATDLARRMVTQWGMSDTLGPMVYGEEEGEIFLGRQVTTHRNVSEATMQKVDAEIRRIIDQQYSLARRLLEENSDKVEAMTAALLEWETIDAEQVNDIMAGRPPRPPKPAAVPPSRPKDDAPGAAPTAPAPAA